jgi:hypothetical protein
MLNVLEANVSFTRYRKANLPAAVKSSDSPKFLEGRPSKLVQYCEKKMRQNVGTGSILVIYQLYHTSDSCKNVTQVTLILTHTITRSNFAFYANFRYSLIVIFTRFSHMHRTCAQLNCCTRRGALNLCREPPGGSMNCTACSL